MFGLTQSSLTRPSPSPAEAADVGAARSLRRRAIGVAAGAALALLGALAPGLPAAAANVDLGTLTFEQVDGASGTHVTTGIRIIAADGSDSSSFPATVTLTGATAKSSDPESDGTQYAACGRSYCSWTVDLSDIAVADGETVHVAITGVQSGYTIDGATEADVQVFIGPVPITLQSDTMDGADAPHGTVAIDDQTCHSQTGCTVLVPFHSQPTVTFTPDATYRVGSYYVDGSRHGGNEYTFTSPVGGAHTISCSFAKITYSVTVNSSGPGTVTSEPATPTDLAIGSDVTFTLTPNEGDMITGVMFDDTDVLANGGVTIDGQTGVGTYEVTDLQADHRLTVTFASEPPTDLGPITFTQRGGSDGTALTTGVLVTFAQGVGDFPGTVAATGATAGDPTNAGDADEATWFVPLTDITAVNGKTVTVTITLVGNYTATGGLSADVTVYGPSNTLTERVKDGVGGQIACGVDTGDGPADPVATTGDDTLTVPYNGGFTCHTTPAEGYDFSNLTDGGESVASGTTGADHEYSQSQVRESHTVEATFTRQTFTVTGAVTSGTLSGTIEPAATQTLDYGATPTYTFTPGTDYAIADVRVDSISVFADVQIAADGTATYTMPAVKASHTIAVSYTERYSIGFQATGHGAIAYAGGDVAAPGPVLLGAGQDATFTFTPESGYETAYVLVDGASIHVSGGSYTFSDVHRDHQITAIFEAAAAPVPAPEPGSDQYVIGAVAQTGGSISPAGSKTYAAGATPTFTITPDAGGATTPGYTIQDVLVDGVSQGAATTFTFPALAANHTIVALFSQATGFAVTATAGPGGAISPAGATTVPVGANAAYTITPNPGYDLSALTVDGVAVSPLPTPDGDGVSTYTLSAVAANHTIDARFAAESEAGTYYTVTAVASSGGAVTPAGVSRVAAAGWLTVHVTADTGYEISSVTATVNGALADVTAQVKESGQYEFMAVARDETLIAVFTATDGSAPTGDHTVTALAGTGGTISPAGPNPVAAAGGIIFTITPNDGFTIASVQLDGTPVATTDYTGGIYALSNVTGDHSVLAQFTQTEPTTARHAYVAIAGDGGAISPSGVSYVDDDAATPPSFTVTADPGHQISGIQVDARPVTVTRDATQTYTFASVDGEDHVIAAVFQPVQYTVTALAGPGGQITPSGVAMVTAGQDATYQVTPNSGYQIAAIYVDGAAYPTEATASFSYEFPDVGADHTLMALFTPTQASGHQITAIAGAGGSITPPGISRVADQATPAYTVTAAAGYQIEAVQVDGSPVALDADVYTFPAVTDDHLITAWFEPVTAPTGSHIVIATAGDGGSISPAGVLTVAEGQNQAFTVTPNPGYAATVTLDGTPMDPDADGTYRVTAVADDHQVLATFAPSAQSGVTHTITTVASLGGQVSPSGTSVVADGASQTLVITPADGFHTAQILVGGQSVTPDDPAGPTTYQLTNIAADQVIMVVFQQVVQYAISAVATAGGTLDQPNLASVTSGQSYDLKITPNVGYQVSRIQVDGVAVNLSRSAQATAHGINQGQGLGASAGDSVQCVRGDPVVCTLANVNTYHSFMVSFARDVAPAPAPITSTPAPSQPAPPAPVASHVQAAIASVTLVKGKSYKIVAAAYTADGAVVAASYKSSKTKVATVTSSGKVKAKKPGSTVVTIASGSVSTRVKIKVLAKKPAKSKVTKVGLKVSKSLRVGQVVWAKATYGPSTAVGVSAKFSSTKRSVATIDKTGRLVAVAPGKATIKVKAGAKTKKVKIKVK